jgi:hypothetical protein
MRERKGIAVLLGLLACGLIAAGCGSDNSDTSTAATSAETSTTEASTTESSTTASSEGATPDDVYNACIDAIAGTPAESVGQSGCQQARDAFETCATQADNAPEGTARNAAIAACQQAADATTAALQSGG